MQASTSRGCVGILEKWQRACTGLGVHLLLSLSYLKYKKYFFSLQLSPLTNIGVCEYRGMSLAPSLDAGTPFLAYSSY
jgi:hypothetical protein